jgi:hypothetical protein
MQEDKKKPRECFRLMGLMKRKGHRATFAQDYSCTSIAAGGLNF